MSVFFKTSLIGLESAYLRKRQADDPYVQEEIGNGQTEQEGV